MFRLFFSNRNIIKNTFSMSQRNFTAACCIIGDEILNGKTRDSNANYLAKYLFELGVDLKRIETIPDDYEAIEETIKRLSSKHDFVFTSGGIGPTHDDITYSALARAFNLPLKLDQETCQRMEEVSKDRFPDWTLTEERKRMAIFPEPSEKLRKHDDMWVPVVVVNKNIHVLPGIPRLFETLLDSLKPHFQALLGDHPAAYHRVQVATKLPEGQIASFLTRLQEQCAEKQIKIGSYPNWGEGKDGARVVVSVVGKDEDEVKAIGDELVKGIEGWITPGKL
ncbi:MAG: MoaB/Mog domain-containing protein [Benjaminiella poitrasii]|nr:MAG: MoaB/Mog domain-containing protein [Benjaminiella poitrasii]